MPLLKWVRQQIGSHLEMISRPRGNLIQYRHQEHANQQSGKQSANYHQSEWPLRIRADAARQRRRQQAEGRDERCHHDGPQPEQCCLARCLDDSLAVEPQFVRIRDVDNGTPCLSFLRAFPSSQSKPVILVRSIMYVYYDDIQ